MIVATTSETMPEGLLIVALVGVFLGGLLILGGVAGGLRAAAEIRRRRRAQRNRWAELRDERRQAARLWSALAEIADPHVDDPCAYVFEGCTYVIDPAPGGYDAYLDHLSTGHREHGNPEEEEAR